MREEAQRYHMDVLAQYSQEMFETLLYPEHITSQNMQQIDDFEPLDVDTDFDWEKLYQGYFARKNKVLYWLDGSVNMSGNVLDVLDLLPIRVKEEHAIKLKNDVVHEVVNPVPYKIIPQKSFATVRQFIDEFLPFQHTHPKHYLLMKFIAIMGIVGKTFLCLATEPGFSKSSVFEVIHFLTDRCPVYKPRSVPGVLNKINSTGNLVFDEVHDCKKDVRDIMEEFALQIGGGKPIYFNGAMKSGNTKNKYDCVNQSITFLFNNTENYKDPEKEYFEFVFSNNKAMDDRFLKLKLKGRLIEHFDKEFNIPKTAESNKLYFVKIAKEMEYLAKLRREDTYKRRFAGECKVKLTPRQKIVYDEITWIIDGYSMDEKEYKDLVAELDTAIVDYREMILELEGGMMKAVEERIEE